MKFVGDRFNNEMSHPCHVAETRKKTEISVRTRLEADDVEDIPRATETTAAAPGFRQN